MYKITVYVHARQKEFIKPVNRDSHVPQLNDFQEHNSSMNFVDVQVFAIVNTRAN